METDSKMGQVGNVSHKMSNLEVFKENNKIVAGDNFPERLKKPEAYYVDPHEEIRISNEEVSTCNEGNNEEVYFTCHGEDANLVGHELIDTEDYTRDCIRESDLQNDQEVAAEVQSSKDDTEKCLGVILCPAENISKQELKKIDDDKKEVSSISSIDDADKWETLLSTDCEKKVSVKKFINIVADIHDDVSKIQDIIDNLAITSNTSENVEDKKIFSEPSVKIIRVDNNPCVTFKNLDAIEIDDTEDNEIAIKAWEYEIKSGETFISSNYIDDPEVIIKKKQDELLTKNITFNYFSTKEHDKRMNLSPSFISIPTEDLDEQEITKEHPLPSFIENEKTERFIYAEQNTDLISKENKNEYKDCQDYNVCRCENLNSTCQFKFKKDLDIPSKIITSKYEAEKVIEDRPSSIKADNEELNMIQGQSKSDKDALQVLLEVSNDLNVSSSESEFEIIECVDYPLTSTQEDTMSQNLDKLKTNKDSSSTPPQKENKHNLAMIVTPFSDFKDSKDDSFCECYYQKDKNICSKLQQVNDKEQFCRSNNWSPDCNENIEVLNDFICSECRKDEEENKNLLTFQAKVEDSSECLSLSVSDIKEKCTDNLKTSEREKKTLLISNSKLEKSEHQRDLGKKKTTDYNGRNNFLKPPKENKYEDNTKEKFHKSAPFGKQELKCSKTSSTNHASNEEDFEIPSDKLAEEIVQQAEFYFSDFNIMKNNFLLKHIGRNREGYLSLKLVSSFRKIKALTRDWRVVAYSLEGSKLLELNAEKNKVRRIEKIQKIQDTSYGKTVVAFNLPFKNPTSEDLKELFSKFGNIVSAEVLTTRSPSYNIYHKRCRYFNQEILSNVFGVVEFEKYADARAAIKDKESHLPKENKVKVVPLLQPKYRPDQAKSRIISSTSFSSSRRSQEGYKPRPVVPRSHQEVDKEAKDIHKPIADKHYREIYVSRYGSKPPSRTDVRGKFSNDRNQEGYKPRSLVPRSRKEVDTEARDIRIPIVDKYFKESYGPSYASRPPSHADIRGNFPYDRIICSKTSDAERNYVMRRQLGPSNALNVTPFHQLPRGQGRFYPAPQRHGTRLEY